ncbi:hypothetical protein C9374_008736 [Naegleria lovaniensis]|uniref:F-box domain-containing protein n=1 Tax=Naegleria lovaniensis TaxID=51637 RepID=A0AA88GEW6_NAELO|nr:uncharacterized protein C9374_008736 [Naegleria lovaniensis]KAG2378114.1 hypothetical protein C9374_008736 [Naegleria lovaniensis]
MPFIKKFISSWKASPTSSEHGTKEPVDSDPNVKNTMFNRTLNISQNQSTLNCSIFPNEILLQILDFIDDCNYEFIGGVFMKVCKQWYCASITGRSISLDFSKCKISRNKFDLIFRTKRQNIQPLLLSNLTELNLEGCIVGKKGLKSIMKCEFISNLTSLNLSYNKFKHRGLKRIAKCTYLSKLTYLNLQFTDPGSELNLTAISQSDFMSNLRVLKLNDCSVPITSLHQIFSSEKMKNLLELKVSAPFFGTDVYLQEFTLLLTAQNSCLKHLTSLSMSSIRQEALDIQSIVNSENLQHLTLLNCKRSGIDDFGASQIATSKYMSNLRELDISNNFLRNDGIKSIANSELMSHLTSLRVGGNNKITAQGAQFIASSQYMKNLTCLRMSHTDIGCEGTSFIASSEFLNQLTDLSLSYTNCGNQGVFHIASSTTLNNLRRLALNGNGIQDLAILTLSQSPSMRQLTALNLHGNNIGSESVVAISLRSQMSRLSILDLSNNYGALSSEIMHLLANSEYMHNITNLNIRKTISSVTGYEHIRPLFTITENRRNVIENITMLNLDGNNIGDEGVKIISQCDYRHHPRLTSLNLAKNNITAKGVQFMTESINFLNILELILDFNEIGNEGAILISHAKHFKNLTSLSVHDNQISKQGEEALTQQERISQNMPKLTRLTLSWHYNPVTVREFL